MNGAPLAFPIRAPKPKAKLNLSAPRSLPAPPDVPGPSRQQLADAIEAALAAEARFNRRCSRIMLAVWILGALQLAALAWTYL